MAERFPTKEETTALRVMSGENHVASGGMVAVNVYKDTVTVSVDGFNVFRAVAWDQIETRVYLSIEGPKP